MELFSSIYLKNFCPLTLCFIGIYILNGIIYYYTQVVYKCFKTVKNK